MDATTKSKILAFYNDHQADVDKLANYLSVPPLWLVALFYNESGLNPNAHNSIGAVGLNQMLPSTLVGLNSSPSAYLNGGVSYQLLIMQDYFKPIAGKIKRAGDLYLFNFLPAAVIHNQAADYILGQKDNYDKYYGISKNQIYLQNEGLDFNHDGKITRQDFWDGFEAKYDAVVKLPDNGSFFFRDLVIDLKTNWWVWLVIVLVVLAIGYFTVKVV